MGLYQHLRETWQNLDPKVIRERMITWRRENVITRVEYPSRLDRARALGYRAKPGFVIARVRLLRGGRQRKKFKAGRKPRHMRRLEIINKSYQTIAEERANKKYPNCEVLNSYFLAKDGRHYWFEVILVDKNHPAILADPKINWIASPANRGRVFRGLTSSARKSRGLRRKGKGAEKIRPSLRSHHGRAH